MDDPVQEIDEVVHRLTQSPPEEQAEAINQYFSQNASFTHPFCRTGSFNNSRQLIHCIFRWYKIMSPRIDMKVNGVAFDEKNLVLYVSISQVFKIWFVPTHRSAVSLVTVLQLARDESNESNKKYYITSQNDLYQTDQFIKFVFPWGGEHLVLLWHFIATFFCVLAAVIFSPFTQLMQAYSERQNQGSSQKSQKALLDRQKPLTSQAKDVVNDLKTNGAKAAEKVEEKAKS